MGKTIGYAFGGGGARAFTQLGAIKELEKLNIKPDYCAGTSMGAVNAILYAAGYSVDEIINFYKSKNLFDMFSFKITKYGLATNEKLGILIEKMCKAKGYNKLEDLPLPTYVTATDENENSVTIKNGSIQDAIRATTATVCVEHYKMANGQILKDGGYTRNVPFEVLNEIRADKNIQGSHFDFCFDCNPNYTPTILYFGDMINKKILKLDRERKTIFEKTETGFYFDLPNSFSAMSFNKVALDKCLKIGSDIVIKDVSKIKNHIFFRLIDLPNVDSKKEEEYTKQISFENTKKLTVKKEKILEM